MLTLVKSFHPHIKSIFAHALLPSRTTFCPSDFPLARRRSLLTLAIETSCDDTSVAILEKRDSFVQANGDPSPVAILHYHEKITADNSQWRGIHPLTAADSHEETLANLVSQSLPHLPVRQSLADQDSSNIITILAEGNPTAKRKPHCITVTRGPGMRSGLTTGLNTAKGLAAAWQIPLLAINHMQAHALTPRLASAMASASPPQPAFPFLSLLVSGGHTMLLHSQSLTRHPIYAVTEDIAVGDALDKMARCILPEHVIVASQDVMYGRLLERFAFPNIAATGFDYTPPTARAAEITKQETGWGWSLPVPLAEKRPADLPHRPTFSFSGLGSAVKRICDRPGAMGIEERVELAREAMRVTFEHLASRVVKVLKYLDQWKSGEMKAISTLVVSGGVAANQYLKFILRAILDAHGYSGIQLAFPPPALCTDNAAMVAWAGLEMYEAGWRSALSCKALPKWSMDPAADERGIEGVDGWVRIESGVTSGI